MRALGVVLVVVVSSACVPVVGTELFACSKDSDCVSGRVCRAGFCRGKGPDGACFPTTCALEARSGILCGSLPDLCGETLNCACSPGPGESAVACLEGRCRATGCGPGLALCEGACVPETVEACGAACLRCRAPQSGTAQCLQGQCRSSCPSGTHLCGDACLRDDSASSCGQRCDPCPVPDGGVATCTGGQCTQQCPTNGPRSRLCEGACVEDDPTHCGASCTRCSAVSGGDLTCVAGTCGFQCPGGAHQTCSGPVACVADSSASCGATCAVCDVNARCSLEGGAPTCVCNAGFVGTGLSCPGLVWSRIYDEPSHGFRVERFPGSGFVFGGRRAGGSGSEFWVLRVDDRGQLVAQRSLGTGNLTGMAVSPDGGVFVSGYVPNPTRVNSLLARLTPTLAVSSSAEISEAAGDGVRLESLRLDGDGVLISGYGSFGSAGCTGAAYSARLLMTDLSAVWHQKQKTSDSSCIDNWNSAIRHSSGAVVATGVINSVARWFASTSVLPGDGGIASSQHQYRDYDQAPPGTSLGNIGMDVVELPGSDLVMVGNSKFGGTGYDAFVARFTAQGVEVWKRRYSGTRNYFQSIEVLSDGTLAVVGDVAVGTDTDALVMQLDAATGAILWQVRVSGPPGKNDRAMDVVEAANGDLVVIGSRGQTGTAWDQVPGDSRLWAFRLQRARSVPFATAAALTATTIATTIAGWTPQVSQAPPVFSSVNPPGVTTTAQSIVLFP
jgi:hypothetical protein